MRLFETHNYLLGSTSKRMNRLRIKKVRENNLLFLTLLTWSLWWVPNNAGRWQMGFNSAFRGLNHYVKRLRQTYSAKILMPLSTGPSIFTICFSIKNSFSSREECIYVFLNSNFRRVLNVVCFLQGYSPAFELSMPTFRNTQFILHTRLWRWNRQSVPKRRDRKFRRRGIT